MTPGSGRISGGWRLTQPSPCIPIEAVGRAGQPAVAICASSFLARGRREGSDGVILDSIEYKRDVAGGGRAVPQHALSSLNLIPNKLPLSLLPPRVSLLVNLHLFFVRVSLLCLSFCATRCRCDHPVVRRQQVYEGAVARRDAHGGGGCLATLSLPAGLWRSHGNHIPQLCRHPASGAGWGPRSTHCQPRYTHADMSMLRRCCNHPSGERG